MKCNLSAFVLPTPKHKKTWNLWITSLGNGA